MLVGIVCPGPSLAYWLGNRPPESHDLWIGVNVAARSWACHWWVCADAKPVRDGKAVGEPQLFTQRQTATRFLHLKPDVDGCHTFEASLTEIPVETGWRRTSMTAAMILAETLIGRTRPAEIRIYGCDWAKGAKYFNGETDILGASPYRFEGEKHTYGQIARWLAARNIELTRMAVPQGVAA